MRLAVIPERCSGCRLCELACALKKFNVMNPKKAGIRVISIYPHPVVRMPVFCRQCREPKCMANCPVEAIKESDGIVTIDEKKCVACYNCVTSCPFGAIYVHHDVSVPIKCDLCAGDPRCVEVCPTNALIFVPEHLLGQARRVGSALRYAHMEEIEYEVGRERKKLRYADIGNTHASAQNAAHDDFCSL